MFKSEEIALHSFSFTFSPCLSNRNGDAKRISSPKFPNRFTVWVGWLFLTVQIIYWSCLLIGCFQLVPIYIIYIIYIYVCVRRVECYSFEWEISSWSQGPWTPRQCRFLRDCPRSRPRWTRKRPAGFEESTTACERWAIHHKKMVKHGDLTMKKCGLTMTNGDLPWFNNQPCEFYHQKMVIWSLTITFD